MVTYTLFIPAYWRTSGWCMHVWWTEWEEPGRWPWRALHLVISLIQSSSVIYDKVREERRKAVEPWKDVYNILYYKEKYFNGYILFMTKLKKTFRTLELFKVDWLFGCKWNKLYFTSFRLEHLKCLYVFAYSHLVSMVGLKPLQANEWFVDFQTEIVHLSICHFIDD